MKRLIIILVSFTVVLASLSGCKSNRHKEYITQQELVKVAPIADQYTANVVMEICEAEYDREYQDALSRAEESKKKRIDCDSDYAGGFTCKERSRSGGGFWGGVASALNKRSAAKKATKGLKETCYLKYGYRLTDKVVPNPNYQGARSNGSEPHPEWPYVLCKTGFLYTKREVVHVSDCKRPVEQN